MLTKDILKSIDTTILKSYPDTTTTITQADANKINELQRILILLIDNVKGS
jgi:hypothetical protein